MDRTLKTTISLSIMSEKQKEIRHLSFEDFRQRAANSSLSVYEKIGFANSFREGKEEFIFRDFVSKLPNLSTENKNVLDIGCGCSDVPKALIAWCKERNHQLTLIDSNEMLNNLGEVDSAKKLPGMFPVDFADFCEANQGKFDVIIVYSLLHILVHDSSILQFIDSTLKLLNHGGQCLIGDIPNVDKRNRLFSSPAGVQFHQSNRGDQSLPVTTFNQINFEELDDAFIFFMMQRARNAGFDSFLLPQPAELPMANRREDLLFVRP